MGIVSLEPRVIGRRPLRVLSHSFKYDELELASLTLPALRGIKRIENFLTNGKHDFKIREQRFSPASNQSYTRRTIGKSLSKCTSQNSFRQFNQGKLTQVLLGIKSEPYFHGIATVRLRLCLVGGNFNRRTAVDELKFIFTYIQ